MSAKGPRLLEKSEPREGTDCTQLSASVVNGAGLSMENIRKVNNFSAQEEHKLKKQVKSYKLEAHHACANIEAEKLKFKRRVSALTPRRRSSLDSGRKLSRIDSAGRSDENISATAESKETRAARYPGSSPVSSRKTVSSRADKPESDRRNSEQLSLDTVAKFLNPDWSPPVPKPGSVRRRASICGPPSSHTPRGKPGRSRSLAHIDTASFRNISRPLTPGIGLKLRPDESDTESECSVVFITCENLTSYDGKMEDDADNESNGVRLPKIHVSPPCETDIDSNKKRSNIKYSNSPRNERRFSVSFASQNTNDCRQMECGEYSQ